ncbi:MAG TPA: hypothetical protein VF598_11200 [Hymenobacter sp.]|jgi:hypothetical protein
MTHDERMVRLLANQATHHLLQQQPMSVTHPADWKRDGFPLPIKRMPADADGTTTQEYRPMAVLEYVQEFLSGEIAAKAAAARSARAKDEAKQ